MTIRLKYPELWPFYTATGDLSSSLALYRYAEYGLLVREKLEVDGPYEIPDSYFTAWRENENGGRSGIGLSSDHSEFEEHKKTILSYAKNQFLINAYSIFEFFIANTTIFLWTYCAGKRESNNSLKFMWGDEKKNEFLQSPVIGNIEDDEWMRDNYKTEEQRKRIQFLENICGLDIRGYSTEVNGVSCDWAKFKSYERLRHNIVHTAGRNSLYTENGLLKKEATKEEILNTFWFLNDLITNLNKQIYTSEIFNHEH